VAVALERARVALSRDDRVHLDDAALAGLRAEPAVDSVERGAARVGHLPTVVERGRDAVVDPLEWHTRDIGTQNFLAQRMKLTLHASPTSRLKRPRVSLRLP